MSKKKGPEKEPAVASETEAAPEHALAICAICNSPIQEGESFVQYNADIKTHSPVCPV